MRYCVICMCCCTCGCFVGVGLAWRVGLVYDVKGWWVLVLICGVYVMSDYFGSAGWWAIVLRWLGGFGWLYDCLLGGCRLCVSAC